MVVPGTPQQFSKYTLESLWERLIKQTSASLMISVLCDDGDNDRLGKKIATDLVEAVADKGTVILSYDEQML